MTIKEKWKQEQENLVLPVIVQEKAAFTLQNLPEMEEDEALQTEGSGKTVVKQNFGKRKWPLILAAAALIMVGTAVFAAGKMGFLFTENRLNLSEEDAAFLDISGMRVTPEEQTESKGVTISAARLLQDDSSAYIILQIRGYDYQPDYSRELYEPVFEETEIFVDEKAVAYSGPDHFEWYKENQMEKENRFGYSFGFVSSVIASAEYQTERTPEYLKQEDGNPLPQSENGIRLSPYADENSILEYTIHIKDEYGNGLSGREIGVRFKNLGLRDTPGINEYIRDYGREAYEEKQKDDHGFFMTNVAEGDWFLSIQLETSKEAESARMAVIPEEEGFSIMDVTVSHFLVSFTIQTKTDEYPFNGYSVLTCLDEASELREKATTSGLYLPYYSVTLHSRTEGVLLGLLLPDGGTVLSYENGECMVRVSFISNQMIDPSDIDGIAFIHSLPEDGSAPGEQNYTVFPLAAQE